MILVDDHLIIVSQFAGLVRVARPDAAGYEERVRFRVSEPGVPISAPAAFADGRIFLRNAEELMAIEVTGGAAVGDVP